MGNRAGDGNSWRQRVPTYVLLRRGCARRMRIIIVVSFTAVIGAVSFATAEIRTWINAIREGITVYARCHSPLSKCKLPNTFSYFANLSLCCSLLINWPIIRREIDGRRMIDTKETGLGTGGPPRMRSRKGDKGWGKGK